MALVTFALTLFVSAFLLFLVQPMIGKLILPRLGGTPQVWNTCMVFFQMVLLAGYFYTHAIGSWLKLPLRKQLLIHGVLLFVPLAILLVGPFNISGWTPPPGENPIVSTLLLLLKIVGIPFFVVSTSAPLLQKWFVHTGDPSARDPYFLYGASNLGSLLSLLAYPFLVEPSILLSQQAWIWTFGYIVLAAMIFYAASLVWNPKAIAETTPPPAIETAAQATAPAPAPSAITAGKRRGLKLPTESANAPKSPENASMKRELDDSMSWARRLRWVLLAAAPSSLMLGVTSYVSTDLSPFPLLWIIPLALYLVTFILVFGRGYSNWLVAAATIAALVHVLGYLGSETTSTLVAYLSYFLLYIAPVLIVGVSLIPVVKKEPLVWVDWPHQWMLYLQPVALAMVSYFVISRVFTGEPLKATIASFFGFFIATLVCHGELARDRPSPKHLTEFFLWMSFGGMLGGMFNAMFAPLWFIGVAEYPIAIIACAVLRPKLSQNGWIDSLLLSGSTEASVIRTSNGVSQSLNGMSNSIRNSLGGKTKDEFVPPNTPWVANIGLDVLIGVLVGLLFYWVRTRAGAWGWFGNDPEENDLLGFLRLILSPFGAAPNARTAQNVALYVGPLLICVALMARNIRFAIALGSLFLIHLYWGERDPNTRVATRSYFGVLKVLEEEELLYSLNTRGGVFRDAEGTLPTFVEGDELEERNPNIRKSFAKIDRLAKDRDSSLIAKQEYVDAVKEVTAKFTYLMHGTTYHGRNYFYPDGLSRLSTTYYHRWGPVGAVMERYNWFPGKQNTYRGDARLAASLVGMSAGSFGFPSEQMTHAWSEPPIATIGLGSGTMASYVRPFQHIGYYEIDDKIRSFSLPQDDSVPHFKYLVEARARGGLVEVIMGDARLSLEREEAREMERTKKSAGDFNNKLAEYDITARRDRYYKVIVVDAFSSDAIPVHLLTKEAVDLYMSKLADDGVLCLHTSNRHLDLIRPISAIVASHNQVAPKDDKWMVVIGTDGRENRREKRSDMTSLGHFGSEYVMVARIDPNKGDAQQRLSKEELTKTQRMPGSEVTWTFQDDLRRDRRPKIEGGRVVVNANGFAVYESHKWYPPENISTDLWTDNFSNIIGILR